MRSTLGIALILILILALAMICVQPVKTQYQGDVTINSDGSITPASAPIVQSGNTYNLTGEVDGSITVNESNIVLNGEGLSLSSGLLIQGVSNVTVEDFVVTDGEELSSNEIDGILLNYASHVTITNNTISGIWSIWELNGVGFCGIDVWGGSSNVITGNSLLNNHVGLDFTNTQNNLIINNNIVDNASQDGLSIGGILFGDASNNTIYHNNIIMTYGALALTPNSVNVWDDGFPAGGNYWGIQTGKEIDSTGISDSPYVIDSLNKDLYPLIQPFNSSFLANYEQEIIPPKISVASPLNETYSKTNVSLAFSIDKPFNWIGYSLDSQRNVTVNGNTTISNIAYGSHSIKIYANSTFGIIGVSKTIDFSIVKIS
jgi:parallel beta-helix repeat protein